MFIVDTEELPIIGDGLPRDEGRLSAWLYENGLSSDIKEIIPEPEGFHPDCDADPTKLEERSIKDDIVVNPPELKELRTDVDEMPPRLDE